MNNDGNANNNNKYNELTAVPLAELIRADMDKQSRHLVPLGSVWDAYYDCVKNKRNTMNAMTFNLDLERKIRRLWREIDGGTYVIGRSIAFIVEHPVKREVFAADFRDRIVHHWICMRLLPLFEAYLSPRMFSNRVGKGTLAAVYNVATDIYAETEGYTRDAWIWKFDIRGFFMSIDKRLLNTKLQAFIDERYEGADKPVLKRLTEQVVMHCPQNNCVRRSKPCAWDGLRADKSLFNQDEWHGLAIGNLTSQLFANFLLSDMVRLITDHDFPRITQYVDDCVVVVPDLGAVKTFIPTLRAWLRNAMGLTLHPRKCYIQHYKKGVAFVGGIIRPHLLYVSKRTVRRGLAKLHWMLRAGVHLTDPEGFLASVNSYLGLAQHFCAYKFRRRIADTILAERSGLYAFTGGCYSMEILKTQYHD